MNGTIQLTPEFVDSLPEKLEEGKLYVSMKFSTAAHKCCCGCGAEIITSIRPKRWTLIYNGEAISLIPSIGNGQLNCRSHYWITENKVRWHRDDLEKGVRHPRFPGSASRDKNRPCPSGLAQTIQIKGESNHKIKAPILKRLKSWLGRL